MAHDLKIEFSKAADYNRIDKLFDPAVKSAIDPHNYVVKRLNSAFQDAVNKGCGVFLSDQAGDVQCLTMAYHTHLNDNPPPGANHDFTEFGTSISLRGGYNCAQLVVTVLALNEWWNHKPNMMTVAMIKATNVPSLKTYRDALGWKAFTDPGVIPSIFNATDKTLAGVTGPSTLAPDENWYNYDEKALSTHAHFLIEYMNQGGLINKRTGDKLNVDFSEIDKTGLTRPRLEAIMRGVTDRNILQNITGP